MEAKSFEGKRTFKEKANKDAILEEDLDDDFDEEEGEMISFAENDKKKLGAAVSGKRGSSGGSSGMSSPSCQAERCGADLTDAKRYHRRHKVCEFHSKASVVIISGLRQRFCQQCSRFHELSEFDEAKRSCRRRLAGHNERRRKSSAESNGEGSSRKGVGNQLKESQSRQADDQRSRIQATIPGNSSCRHLQIK